jgi:zinc protease
MAVDRSRLPHLGPEPAFAFPTIERRALANGVRVWTIEHRDVPIVTAFVMIPVGSASDPPQGIGTAAMAADLLDEGCGAWNALEFHEALGRLGAHVETEVSSDATLLSLTTLERFAERGAGLLARMVIEPRFEPREFDRVRDLRLSRLVQMRDLPSAVADRAFAELLYGNHPYGHLPIGSEESLRNMAIDDVHAFHRRAYVPSRATVFAVGDATHDRLFDMIDESFGGWTALADPLSPPAVSAPPPIRDHRLALVDRPGAAQSELRIGHVAAPRSTPDYHALITLNTVLGGQFVSRINMNLREEKGYTYGARTSFEFRRGPGPFVLQASVQSDATADAIRESIAEMQAIRGPRPVTRAELQLGRAALTRGYPTNFETGEQVGRAAAQLAIYDLPDDYFSRFVPQVLSLTEADLTRVATTHIDPARLSAVIVGDRKEIGSLNDLGLGDVVEVGVSTEKG